MVNGRVFYAGLCSLGMIPAKLVQARRDEAWDIIGDDDLFFGIPYSISCARRLDA